MQQQRSDISGNSARNDHSIAFNERKEGAHDSLSFKNSRLHQLEKKFNQQRMKSKDKIDQMHRKIERLLHVNETQQEKIKRMACEKSETLAHVDSMHEKLNLLN